MYETDLLNNLIKQQVIAVLSMLVQTRIGVISAYDPNTYTAQVMIQPEGFITNWLPIKSDAIGNGFGAYYGPNLGDMVKVSFQEGDFSTGIIDGFIFNSVDIPISPSPTNGEYWIVHKTGSFLKFMSDGTIQFTTLDANGNPTNLIINGNLVVQGTGAGNITATGNILDNSESNTDDMKGMRNVFNEHTHGGVFTGGANTLEPNQEM